MSLSLAKQIRHTGFLLFVLTVMLSLGSCTIIRNTPDAPYVYRTNIVVEGDYARREKKEINAQLELQLHDSVQVRTQQKFIFFTVVDKPPVFDSLNAAKSVTLMNAMLNNIGYYRDSIGYNVKIDTTDKGLQTSLEFHVYPGKLITLDSISINLLDSVEYRPMIDTLQQLTKRSQSETFIRKGDAFSKPRISSELDRLSDVYRNNGFLRFTRQDLITIWDTVGIDLLRPVLDPLEQAAQFEELQKRRLNPIADLELRLRTPVDTSHLTRYYVGEVNIYPDYNPDTTLRDYRKNSLLGFNFYSRENKFRINKLTDFVYLHPGEMYRQNNYLKTQNRFNSIGSWRTVTINTRPRPGTDSVDFDVRLIPYAKYFPNINLEGSRNSGSPITSSNLIGLGVYGSLLNRNFSHSAAQSTLTLRYGVELNTGDVGEKIQTRQANLQYSVRIPRALPKWLFKNYAEDGVRTVINTNLGLTDRTSYYTLRSFNTSLNYDFRHGNNSFSIRFPNIEYNALRTYSALDVLIQNNQSYRFIFNDGFIVSSIANLRKIWSHNVGDRGNVLENLTLVLELAGVPGLLHNAVDHQYRFVKMDADYVHNFKFRRSQLAWRIFGGVGYSIPFGTDDKSNNYLPFFRSYYGGGPNSMRAWAVRKLGPGSAVKSFDRTIAPDRFGDMRLELNGEYRFYAFLLFGFKVEGALFMDMGNIWFLRENTDFPGGNFAINKLWKDIAIGTGTGMRVDFSLLQLRLDYAYKVKNPSPDEIAGQNKFFYNWQWNGGQFQLGINYPF